MGACHHGIDGYFTSGPATLNLERFIMRVPFSVLANGARLSNIRNHSGTVESGDPVGVARPAGPGSELLLRCGGFAVIVATAATV